MFKALHPAAIFCQKHSLVSEIAAIISEIIDKDIVKTQSIIDKDKGQRYCKKRCNSIAFVCQSFLGLRINDKKHTAHFLPKKLMRVKYKPKSMT